jgi:hypothetical protein
MAFREMTGLSAKWLRKFEEWEIITAERRKGKWVYSSDNVTIGKLIVEMSRIGLGPQDGFDAEDLKRISDIFKDTILKGREQFMESYSGKLSPEEMAEKGRKMNELMGIYYYHLYRKYSNEENQRGDALTS